MPETTLDIALLVIIVGVVIVASLLAKAACERVRLPPLVAYLLIGFALRAAEEAWGVLPDQADRVFEFLAKLGVIALLFTVGLKSQISRLVGQLRRASWIWLGNILVSGGLGFGVAWWLGLGLVPSIVIGVAMTATSVGVSSAIWERTNAIDSGDGQLFVDVAELDDISGVLFLAVLFAMLPTLRGIGAGADSTQSGFEWTSVLTTVGLVLITLLVFAAACFLFARFARPYVVRFLEHRESPTDAVISLTCVGIIIAGIAGVLGFSVAIGGFFAGLAFSGNREAIQNRTPYQTLHDLFVPFFFVGIGLSVAPSSLTGSWVLPLFLVAAAIAGKMVGTGIPGLVVTSPGSALVCGVAMVPRAEIAMIVMHRGLRQGEWAVTPSLFSAMVCVVLVTCLAAPPALDHLIRRHVKQQEAST